MKKQVCLSIIFMILSIPCMNAKEEAKQETPELSNAQRITLLEKLVLQQTEDIKELVNAIKKREQKELKKEQELQIAQFNQLLQQVAAQRAWDEQHWTKKIAITSLEIGKAFTIIYLNHLIQEKFLPATFNKIDNAIFEITDNGIETVFGYRPLANLFQTSEERAVRNVLRKNPELKKTQKQREKQAEHILVAEHWAIEKQKEILTKEGIDDPETIKVILNKFRETVELTELIKLARQHQQEQQAHNSDSEQRTTQEFLYASYQARQ